MLNLRRLIGPETAVVNPATVAIQLLDSPIIHKPSLPKGNRLLDAIQERPIGDIYEDPISGDEDLDEEEE